MHQPASALPPATALPARARRLLAAAAWLLAVAVAAHFLAVAAHTYSRFDAASYGMFWDRRAWLWLHLGGGTLTLVLGALQFIPRLRTRTPRVHRWVGRLYLGGVLLGLAGAAGLIATSPAPAAIRIAFASTALAWLATALAGYLAIRRGQVARHRRWMIRNYLVTLAPALFRLALAAPGVMALAPPTLMIPLLLWLSWALPLALHLLWTAATAPRSALAPGPA